MQLVYVPIDDVCLFNRDSERIKVSIHQKHEKFAITNITLCIYKC